MSDTSTGDPGKPMKQPSDDLSKVMGQLSVTSNKTSQQPKNLSDMPFDVVGLIIERSDYKRQLLLRTVSKSLRALVDRVTPACKSILIICQMENIIITFDNNDLVYTNDEYYDRCNGITVIKDKKVAFDYLASTLKNPRLKLEDFGVSYENYQFTYLDECYKEIQRVSESLNHQVSVKKIQLDQCSSSMLLSILPHLKPGVLEKISLDFYRKYYDWEADTTGMEEVALLEQWKQANEIELMNCFNRFPMKYATHFKRFEIRGIVININVLDHIKEFLSKLDNFEYCRITHFYRNDIDDVQRVTGIPVPPNMSHYSIPDSDSCLEFSFVSDGITIVKKICRLH